MQAVIVLQRQYESLPPTLVESFTTKSAQLSWDLLTTIPPLLSLTPPSSYFKQWHEKELAPTWNKELTSYELVYYRPVLFMSCEGKVARKGWVGNQGALTVTDTQTGEDKRNFKQTVDYDFGSGVDENKICEHCGCFMIPESQDSNSYKPLQLVQTKYHQVHESDGASETQQQIACTDSNKDQVTTKYFPQGELSLKVVKSSPKTKSSTSTIGVKLL